MYIDTRSKDRMEQSVCALLNITPDMLYGELLRIGRQVGNDYDSYTNQLEIFIGEHFPKSLPDEVLFFHLSRRLKETEDDAVGHNLLHMLTTDNPFSSFLKKHDIEFQKGENHIEVFNRGKLVNWDKCWSGNSSYMQWRLGYFKGREDFCFNGFAFKDLLYKNEYARSLSGVPEFLGQLIACLERPEIGYAYMKQSSYYCYEYLIPFGRVMFDEHEEYSLGLKQRYLIRCVIERLDKYENSNVRYMYDDDNPVLRLKDDDTLESAFCITKETITADMLG